MSTSRVGKLLVYCEEDGNNTELPQESTQYRIVEEVIHLALSLLETQEGRRSLVDVATEIIQPRNNSQLSSPRRPRHIYRDSMQNLPQWIERFLRSMRNNFPPVGISDEVDGEADAEPHNWGHDMAQYDAGAAAGFLWLNKGIINNMTDAWQQGQGQPHAQSAYDLFKFQMTISVAHEIVHLLTGFLTGPDQAHTPPEVTAAAPLNTKGNKGEAGRNWERKLLGGSLEHWSSNTDPLQVRQAGVPYLFNAGDPSTANGQPVCMTYVREFVSGCG
jgi:hypothetical protein